MDNNDIVPQIAIDILQRAGLYSPFETIEACDDDMIKTMNLPKGFTADQIDYLINNFIASDA